MASWYSVDNRLKESNLDLEKYPGVDQPPQVSSLRKFFKSVKEHLIMSIVSLILISAFLQHIFREPLLTYLRSILEHWSKIK
jgi:hypothetical protein